MTPNRVLACAAVCSSLLLSNVYAVTSDGADGEKNSSPGDLPPALWKNVDGFPKPPPDTPSRPPYGIYLCAAWSAMFLFVLAVTAFWFWYKHRFEKRADKKRVHSRMTFVAVSSSQEGSRKLAQQGYQKSGFGSTVKVLWHAFLAASWIQMLLFCIDSNLMPTSDVQDDKPTLGTILKLEWTFEMGPCFLLLFTLSHAIILLWVLYSERASVWFLLAASLEECTFVQVTNSPVVNKEADRLSARLSLGEDAGDSCLDENSLVDTERCLVTVKKDEAMDRSFFEYRCIRYFWDGGHRFRSSGTLDLDSRQVVERVKEGGLTTKQAQKAIATFGTNAISVPVPSVLSSLLTELATPMNVYQIACIWLYTWQQSCNISGVWLIILLGVCFYRSLFIVRKNQKKLAEMAGATASSIVDVMRNGEWIKLRADELVPGDVLAVREGQPAPCDCVLEEK